MINLFENIILDNGNNKEKRDKVKDNDLYNERLTYHSIGMTLSWSIFSFIGFFYSRYMRSHPHWLFYHQVCNGLSAACSIASGLLAINLCNCFYLMSNY